MARVTLKAYIEGLQAYMAKKPEAADMNLLFSDDIGQDQPYFGISLAYNDATSEHELLLSGQAWIGELPMSVRRLLPDED